MVAIVEQQIFHLAAPCRLFGYRCQPYFLASMVYFIIPFDIYNVQKHYI